MYPACTLEARGESKGGPEAILDLPCGHGRVLRYLRAAFPRTEITACDLNRDGVDFCASQFRAIPVYSDVDASRVPLPRDKFDLIWVGSLLTHLDAPLWIMFLDLFRAVLRPGGLLVFSTQGRLAHHLLTNGVTGYDLDGASLAAVTADYESYGFGYANYSDAGGYGIALSESSWVCRLITSLPDFRIVSVSERSWDNHHDVFACVRDVDWAVHHPRAPAFRGTSPLEPPPASTEVTQRKRLFRWRRSA